MLFVLLVARRFVDDRCGRAAGALSFTTLFAIVPLMVVGLAMISIFPAFHGWSDKFQDVIYRNFVPTAGEAVQRYIEQFAANTGRLTVWGLVFVFVTAYMVLSSIERTFNDIWHVTQPRSRIRRLLGYWALLTLGPILIVLSLSLTTTIVSTPLFGSHSALGDVRALIFTALPWLFEAAAFVLLYMVGPNYPVRPRHALIGGVLAVLLFEMAKRAFILYVTRYANYQAIYGAVAVLPVFLMWIYVSWMILLLGAVVVAALPQWGPAGSETGAGRRVSP